MEKKLIAKVLATGKIVELSEIKAHEGLYIDNDNNVYKREELSFALKDVSPALPEKATPFNYDFDLVGMMPPFKELMKMFDTDEFNKRAEQQHWENVKLKLIMRLIDLYETKLYCEIFTPKDIVDKAEQFITELKAHKCNDTHKPSGQDNNSLERLIGMEVVSVTNPHCDTCCNKEHDCVKIAIAGGGHICLKHRPNLREPINFKED